MLSTFHKMSARMFSFARRKLFGWDYATFDEDRRSRLVRRLEQAGGGHVWNPGDPIPATGRRLLVGVSLWSGVDVKLLEQIAHSRPSFAADIVIEFCDLDLVAKHMTEQYYPGVEKLDNTPVAGLWRDGMLVEFAQGCPARDLVDRILQ